MGVSCRHLGEHIRSSGARSGLQVTMRGLHVVFEVIGSQGSLCHKKTKKHSALLKTGKKIRFRNSSIVRFGSAERVDVSTLSDLWHRAQSWARSGKHLAGGVAPSWAVVYLSGSSWVQGWRSRELGLWWGQERAQDEQGWSHRQATPQSHSHSGEPWA